MRQRAPGRRDASPRNRRAPGQKRSGRLLQRDRVAVGGAQRCAGVRSPPSASARAASVSAYWPRRSKQAVHTAEHRALRAPAAAPWYRRRAPGSRARGRSGLPQARARSLASAARAARGAGSRARTPGRRARVSTQPRPALNQKRVASTRASSCGREAANVHVRAQQLAIGRAHRAQPRLEPLRPARAARAAGSRAPPPAVRRRAPRCRPRPARTARPAAARAADLRARSRCRSRAARDPVRPGLRPGLRRTAYSGSGGGRRGGALQRASAMLHRLVEGLELHCHLETEHGVERVERRAQIRGRVAFGEGARGMDPAEQPRSELVAEVDLGDAAVAPVRGAVVVDHLARAAVTRSAPRRARAPDPTRTRPARRPKSRGRPRAPRRA